MADLTTSLCGVPLRNPFLLAAGPLSYGAEGLIAAHRAGAAAVVTKTIRCRPACNPRWHIVPVGRGSLINCEEWSDLDPREWIEREIPRAAAEGVTVIASVGGTREDVRALVKPLAAAGARLIEVVGGYSEPADITDVVAEAADLSPVPCLVKVNANWPAVEEVAWRCLEAGASGVTAIDSIGPVLRIDVGSGRPLLGGKRGQGWLSGSAILPVALRVVADIACRGPVEVVGTGGVSTPEEALEMLMAGATAVGVCTAAILEGLDVFSRLTEGLARLLQEGGYGSVMAVRGRALTHLTSPALSGEARFRFREDLCTGCGACARICPYGVRRVEAGRSEISGRCRACGLCAAACPTGALELER